MNFEEKEKYGIHRKDPRFSEKDENNSFMSKYKTGTLKINNWIEFTNIIKEIFK